MSAALSVHHGPFGRAALYHLNRPFATHAHREGHLIFSIAGAPAMVRVDSECHSLTPSQGVAVNAWQPHSFHPGDGASLIFVVYFDHGWFARNGQPVCGQPNFARNRIECDLRIAELIDRAYGLLKTVDGGKLLDDTLHELAVACLLQSGKRVDTVGEAPGRADNVRDFRIRKSIKFMQHRLRDSLVLDHVARESGLSRPHFFKLFRENTGLTPNVFLNTLRVENSLDRLLKSEETITVIGLDLGFASQASFTRFFASNVGIAPTEYRRAARGH